MEGLIASPGVRIGRLAAQPAGNDRIMILRFLDILRQDYGGLFCLSPKIISKALSERPTGGTGDHLLQNRGIRVT